MFDIGFAELIIIFVVGLLVIGPERLPATLRTASLWLARFKRSFNDIKREVEQDLHNDEVMRELKQTRDELQGEVSAVTDKLSIDALTTTSDAAAEPAPDNSADALADAPAADTTDADAPTPSTPRQPADKQ